MTLNTVNEERKPKVSVIVNNFNKGKYIEECLNSIKVQTYGFKNLQLVIWDDNSTDDSYKIIQQWMLENSDFENVNLYRTGDVIGHYGSGVLPLGVTRWLALNKCVGQYVAICDSDDVWVDSKLEKQIPLFNDDVGIAYSDCLFFKDSPKEGDDWEWLFHTFHDQYPMFEKDVFFNLLTNHNFMPASTLVFNRLFLKSSIKAPTHYTSGEDYDWCLRVCEHFKAVCCHDGLTYYRIVDDSLTHNSRKSTRATWFEIDCALSVYNEAKKGFSKIQRIKFYQHLCLLYCKLIWKQFVRERIL